MCKIIITILSLIVLISCNQKKNKNPSEFKFIDIDSVKNEKSSIETDIISPTIKMLDYLTANFERIQDSTFLKKPEWMKADKTDTICGYVISFKERHSFKHQQECVEWGEIVTVKFNDFSPNQVREIVQYLFENKNYDWYENKTEYRPEKDYERLWTFRIIKKEKATDLEFAYSWI